MKNYMILTAMLLAMALTQPAKSQVSVNISVQPLWGPVGYSHVDYYYLPDYEVYYSVPQAQFVYFDAGQWIFAPALPPRFGSINYYSAYKVVVNQPKAYLYYDKHKVKYAGYKGKGPKQIIIRDSREPKYYVVKGHPNYGQAKKVSSGPSNGGQMKAAPKQQGNQQIKSSPAPHGNAEGGGGNKGGGHGGGKGGGKK